MWFFRMGNGGGSVARQEFPVLKSHFGEVDHEILQCVMGLAA
jgi:hypothetical protein